MKPVFTTGSTHTHTHTHHDLLKVCCSKTAAREVILNPPPVLFLQDWGLISCDKPRRFQWWKRFKNDEWNIRKHQSTSTEGRFNFMFPGYVLGDGHGEDLGQKLGLTNGHLGTIWTGNGWSQTGTDQWPLSDIINTPKRFCHIIRNFADYLLNLTMFVCVSCMYLKEPLTSSGWRVESLLSGNSLHNIEVALQSRSGWLWTFAAHVCSGWRVECLLSGNSLCIQVVLQNSSG